MQIPDFFYQIALLIFVSFQNLFNISRILHFFNAQQVSAFYVVHHGARSKKIKKYNFKLV